MSLTKVSFGADVPGYVGGEKGRPGVVVLQEWWGVNDQVKEQAEYIAKEGNYRVLVPDLYKYDAEQLASRFMSVPECVSS